MGRLVSVSSPGSHWLGGVVYFLLVIFFTYFYTAVIYNVQDISDNLKKHGSFVPGLRPGKQTEKYIDFVLTRITFAGAIFLGVVALLPYIIPVILRAVGRRPGSEHVPAVGRHLAADRGRGRAGNDETNRGASGDAALRRVY